MTPPPATPLFRLFRTPSARRRRFTLTEVLIAAAILGVGLALTFQSLGVSRARLLRAERRWARRHNLDQALEFYLLAGPDAKPPPGLLPEGFRMSCTVEPAPQDELPADAPDEIQGWTLAKLRVTVTWRDGTITGEQTVYKIIRADALR